MSRFGDLAFGPVAKGDLNVGSGTGVGTLPIGSAGQVLTVDLTQPLDVKWATPATAAPAGADGVFQFNNVGVFGGAVALRRNPSTGNIELRTDTGVVVMTYTVASGVFSFTNPTNAHVIMTINSSGEAIGWFNAGAVVQQVANVSLTDSTTGTPALTLVDVTTLGVADPSKCNDNFSSINAQLAAIRTLLTNYGLGT